MENKELSAIRQIISNCEEYQRSGESAYHKEREMLRSYDDIVEVLKGSFEDTVYNSVKSLIDSYGVILEDLVQDRESDKGLTPAHALKTGKIGVYAKVIEDLKGVIDYEG